MADYFSTNTGVLIDDAAYLASPSGEGAPSRDHAELIKNVDKLCNTKQDKLQVDKGLKITVVEDSEGAYAKTAHIQTEVGAGLTYDVDDKVTVKLGDSLETDSDGKIVAKPDAMVDSLDAALKAKGYKVIPDLSSAVAKKAIVVNSEGTGYIYGEAGKIDDVWLGQEGSSPQTIVTNKVATLMVDQGLKAIGNKIDINLDASAGLQFTSDKKLAINPGSGLTFDPSGELIPNLGSGLTIDPVTQTIIMNTTDIPSRAEFEDLKALVGDSEGSTGTISSKVKTLQDEVETPVAGLLDRATDAEAEITALWVEMGHLSSEGVRGDISDLKKKSANHDTELANIKNGVTPAGKAICDSEGNIITLTYQKAGDRVFTVRGKDTAENDKYPSEYAVASALALKQNTLKAEDAIYLDSEGTQPAVIKLLYDANTLQLNSSSPKEIEVRDVKLDGLAGYSSDPEQLLSKILDFGAVTAVTNNVLADLETVNYKITTLSGTYRGGYNTKADLEAAYPPGTIYPVDSEGHCALQNNDYAYSGLVDSEGNRYLIRYKSVCIATYDPATGKVISWQLDPVNGWSEEYRFKASAFGAKENAALQSGINAGKVTAYDNHLSLINNPHGVTQAQVGLSNVDNMSKDQLQAYILTKANVDALGYQTKDDLANDYKAIQTAVDDPATSGENNSLQFIDTIKQNYQGVITPTKRTIPLASASQSGAMSATDKQKLDGISNGANKVQASLTSGNLLIDGVEVQIMSNATSTSPGLMSAQDKLDFDADHTKLAAITPGSTKTEPSANNGKIIIDGTEQTVYTHPLSAGGNLSSAIYKFTTDPQGHVSGGTAATSADFKAVLNKADLDSLIGLASSTENGLMSKVQNDKLAAIYAEANKVEDGSTNGYLKVNGVDNAISAYILPTMSATEKGGAQVGDGLTMTSDILNVKKASTTELGGVIVDGTTVKTAALTGILSLVNEQTLPTWVPGGILKVTGAGDALEWTTVAGTGSVTDVVAWKGLETIPSAGITTMGKVGLKDAVATNATGVKVTSGVISLAGVERGLKIGGTTTGFLGHELDATENAENASVAAIAVGNLAIDTPISTSHNDITFEYDQWGHIKKKPYVRPKYMTCVLPVSAAGSVDVAIAGITASDTPIVNVLCNADIATASEERGEWSKVYKAETSDDSIKFYLLEATNRALNVQIVL